MNVCIAIALKGQQEIAQGNALGKWHTKTPSPERAKGVIKWLLRPFRAYLIGDLLPGVCAPLYPGLSHFTPSGLKIQIDNYRFNVPVIFADEERLIHIYKLEAQATE